MAKKPEEIVLGAECIVRPLPFMKPPIVEFADEPKSSKAVMIVGSILMAAAIAAFAIWGSAFAPTMRSFASDKMAEMKMSWAGLSVPSKQVLVARENERIEKACDAGALSKLCMDLKIAKAVKANEERSWENAKKAPKQ